MQLGEKHKLTKIHFIKSIHPAILYNLKHSTSALKVTPISGLPMHTDRECNCSLKIPSHCKGQRCGEQSSQFSLLLL